MSNKIKNVNFVKVSKKEEQQALTCLKYLLKMKQNKNNVNKNNFKVL